MRETVHEGRGQRLDMLCRKGVEAQFKSQRGMSFLFLILILLFLPHRLLLLIKKSLGIARHMSAKKDRRKTRNLVQVQERD